jgi:hypothetical protein
MIGSHYPRADYSYAQGHCACGNYGTFSAKAQI